MSAGTIFDDVPDSPANEIMWTSASQLASLMRCKFQFYGAHILKYKDPVNSNLYFGSMFDETLNYNYGDKKTSEKDLPKATLQDFFRTQFDAQKEKVVEWAEDANVLKELGTKGVGVFYDEVIPDVMPAEVQPKLSLTFKGDNVIMNGRPDVIEIAAKGHQIVDNKTSVRAQTETYIKQALQPVIYSIMTGDGSTADREVRYDILVKTKVPKYQPLKTIITEGHRQAALKVIKNHLDLVKVMKEKKNFPPDAFFRGGWECGYCPVAGLCKQVWGLDIPESKIAQKAKAKAPVSLEMEADILAKASEVKAKGGDVPNVIEQLKPLEDAAKKKHVGPEDDEFRAITI